LFLLVFGDLEFVEFPALREVACQNVTVFGELVDAVLLVVAVAGEFFRQLESLSLLLLDVALELTHVLLVGFSQFGDGHVERVAYVHFLLLQAAEAVVCDLLVLVFKVTQILLLFA